MSHFGGTQIIDAFNLSAEARQNYAKQYKDADFIANMSKPMRAHTSRGVIPWKGGQVRVALSLGDVGPQGIVLSPIGYANMRYWFDELGETFGGISLCEIKSVSKIKVQKRLDHAHTENVVCVFFTANSTTLDELGVLLFGYDEWVSPAHLRAAHSMLDAIVKAKQGDSQ